MRCALTTEVAACTACSSDLVGRARDVGLDLGRDRVRGGDGAATSAGSPGRGAVSSSDPKIVS